MTGDIVQMGAYIGAGLACICMGGAALGVGNVVGNFLSGALRNPSAAGGQTQLPLLACGQDRQRAAGSVRRPFSFVVGGEGFEPPTPSV